MKTWFAEIGSAVRNLRRNRGFAAASVLTLGVGIGGTTAIFSVVDQVLLRPFAFDVDGVVDFWFDIPSRNRTDWQFSNETFEFVRDTMRSVPQVAIVFRTFATVQTSDGPSRVATARVSASFFDIVGVAPVLGQFFGAEQDRVGAAPVAVITEGMWRREFGADRSIIGDDIRLGDDLFTVLGVFPTGPQLVERSLRVSNAQALDTVDIYIPVAPFAATLPPHVYVYGAVGRLAPGVSLGEAREELAALTEPLLEAAASDNLVPRMNSYRDRVIGSSRAMLLALFGSAGTVLLVVTANLSSLVLARGSARAQEWSVRRALGASSFQVARQLVAETLVVAAMGGVVGLALATWLMSWLRSAAGVTLPRVEELGLDPRVLCLAVIVTLGSALSFGLLPVAKFSRCPATAVVQARGSRLTRRGKRGLQALVSIEVATAFALAVGSITLVQSLHQLLAQEAGYEADGLLTLRLDLPEAMYASDAEIGQFGRAVTRRMAALPGVETAAIMSSLPLLAPGQQVTAESPDGPLRAASREAAIDEQLFDALKMRLVEGRTFSAADVASAAPVVILSEALARGLWPDESAVGKSVEVGSWRLFSRTGGSTSEASREVVGVVRDFRTLGMAGGDPAPYFFMPFDQAPWPQFSIMVRTGGDPAELVPAVRSVIADLDPELPVFDVEPLQASVARNSQRERFGASVLSGFAIVSVLLAMVGVYGVASYTVALQTREIGVRVALGGDPRSSAAMVLRSSMGPLVVGALTGLGLALAGSRFMTSLVYEVEPGNLPTLAITAALMIGVALLATYLPARRASRLDPVAALRIE